MIRRKDSWRMKKRDLAFGGRAQISTMTESGITLHRRGGDEIGSPFGRRTGRSSSMNRDG